MRKDRPTVKVFKFLSYIFYELNYFEALFLHRQEWIPDSLGWLIR